MEVTFLHFYAVCEDYVPGVEQGPQGMCVCEGVGYNSWDLCTQGVCVLLIYIFLVLSTLSTIYVEV